MVLCMLCLVRFCVGPFETQISLFFVAVSPSVSHLPWDTFWDSLLFGSVLWSVEASSAVPYIHPFMGVLPGLSSGCVVVVWIAGDQTLGWETLGAVKVWGSGCRTDVWERPWWAGLWLFFLGGGGGPGSSELRLWRGGLLVCPVICSVLLLNLSL